MSPSEIKKIKNRVARFHDSVRDIEDPLVYEREVYEFTEKHLWRDLRRLISALEKSQKSKASQSSSTNI